MLARAKGAGLERRRGRVGCFDPGGETRQGGVARLRATGGCREREDRSAQGFHRIVLSGGRLEGR